MRKFSRSVVAEDVHALADDGGHLAQRSLIVSCDCMAVDAASAPLSAYPRRA
jgi:hypothetical protein